MKRKIAYVCLALLVVGIAGMVGYNRHVEAQQRQAYSELLAEYNRHCDDLVAMFTTTQAKQLIQDSAAHGEHAAQIGSSYAEASADARPEIARAFLSDIKVELDDFHELTGLMRPHVVAANEAAGNLRKINIAWFNVDRKAMAQRLKDALKPLSALDGVYASAAAVVEIKMGALHRFQAQHDGSTEGFDDSAEMLKAATAVLDATVAPAPAPDHN
jgi:hypothetical protein